MMFGVIAIVVFLLLIVGMILAFLAARMQRKEFLQTGKHPKGHYKGIGMAVGMAIGTGLGVALGSGADNTVWISLGPGMGLPIGLAIGALWEKKHKDELRPLTKKELELRKKVIIYGVGTVLLGVVVFAAVLFLAGR